MRHMNWLIEVQIIIQVLKDVVAQDRPVCLGMEQLWRFDAIVLQYDQVKQPVIDKVPKHIYIAITNH